MFCKHKFNAQEVSDFQSILDDISYTCGTTFDDLELPGRLVNVFVKDHSCTDVIEKLYYVVLNLHCSSEEVTDTIDSDFLPHCEECVHLERIRKPKKKS